MPLDSLNNRQYIKDDVLFIKIIVDWLLYAPTSLEKKPWLGWSRAT
jgi:hypothetical protein